MITPGMRFGKLTVVAYAYTKNKRKYFKCKCDCGNETVVLGTSLKKHITKSCGCLKHEIKREKEKFAPGTKFGKLTIIKFAYMKNGQQYYQCKCECGNEKIIMGHSLETKHTQSCGCLKHTPTPAKIIEQGMKFGKLTVIKFAYTKDRKKYFLCKCDCGNTKIILGASLTNGHTKSCGCIRRHSIRKLIEPGTKFGKLTVIKFAYVKNNARYYHCHCECGNNTIVLGSALKKGTTKSCGCEQHKGTITHGMRYTRFYSIWKHMKQRCLNKNNKHFPYYGGRGITICQEWIDNFENFYNDMYESYLKHIEEFGEKETTIDRINVNGNYEPNNCCWATRSEQSFNRRNTILVREDENSPWQSLHAWCKEHNENYNTWIQRYLNKSKLFTLEIKRRDNL